MELLLVTDKDCKHCYKLFVYSEQDPYSQQQIDWAKSHGLVVKIILVTNNGLSFKTL